MAVEKLTRLIELYKDSLADCSTIINDQMLYMKQIGVDDQQDSGGEETFVARLTEYMSERERRFQAIQVREKESATIHQSICTELGMSEFTLSALKARLPFSPDFLDKTNESQNLISELTTLLEQLTQAMEELKAIDKQFEFHLKKETEEVKGQLYRMKNSRQVRNAYQTDYDEAFYIDKNK